MKWTGTLLGTCLLLVTSLSHAAEMAPFADGDVVAVIGDSITHDGRWQRFIGDFYATRFPTRHITILNNGIGGDMVGGVLRRLDDDILAAHPNVAVVMLGMNDVGRTAYTEGGEQDPALIKIRAAALERYRTGMTALLPRLRDGGVKRIILITPSPYEDHAKLATANLPGANDGLTACAAIVKELAAAAAAEVVDFHGPLTTLDRQQQERDPTFTLIGPDRVHPGSVGHLLMAHLFLTAQHVPPLVSRVELDATAHSVSSTPAALVSDCQWQPSGVTFTVLAQALPFPLNPDAEAARSLTSIDHDLNREELCVHDLTAASYRLEIDDKVVGTWSAAELASGINLASNVNNPTNRQANAVIQLTEQRRGAQQELRGVALVTWNWLAPAKVDRTDATAVSTAINAYLAKYPIAFNRKLADTYARAQPQQAAIRANIEELSEKIRRAAEPRPHRYRLTAQP